MAIKNINTDLQIEAGLRDGDGDLGTNNQVLISTGTGINWIDGSGTGIIGGPYLPLAGGTMTGTNGVVLPDNFKLNLGNSSDLQIYHNGSNSFIQDTGTGDLYVDAAANFFVRNRANGEVWIKGTDLGVSLRYQDSQKLITTSTGVTITGELQATSLDINGNADISGIISGNFVVRSTNNSNADGANFAVDTTNKSSSEYAYEILRSGTTVAGITTVGKITGTELEGTSLDINGNGDVSGNLTINGALTANGGITGLDIAGGISGNNYNITGVNQLIINDPGEGIVFSGTTNVQLFTIDDATDSILKITSATALDVNAKITNLSPGSTNLDAVNYQQLTDAVAGVLVYQGTWNASTNSPALASGVGTPGYYYIVSTPGSTNLDGITDWNTGDWVIFSDQATDAWQKIDHTNVLNGAGTGNQVTKWSGAGTSYTLTDSVITDDGTNVGIGETNPIYKLTVNSETTDQIARFTSTDVNSKISLEDGTSISYWNLSAGTTSIGSNDTVNSSNLNINSSGRIGIGTTNPTVPLLIQYTDTHTSGDLALTNSALDIYNDSSNDVVGKGSTLTFSDNYSGTNKTTRAAIKGGTDTAGNTADGFLAFYTDTGGANSMQEHMRIDNDGEVLIGTTTPTGAKLLVDHDNTKMLELKRSGNTKARFLADSNHGQLDIYNSATVNTIRLLASGDSYLNGGNVGIGTTSPSAKLEVAADATTNVDIVHFSNSNDIAKAKISLSANSSGELSLIDGSNNTDVFITSNGDSYFNGGDVGIGTASPAAAVDIVRTSLPTTGNDYGVLVDMEKASSTTSYDTSLWGLRSYVRATSTGTNQMTDLNGLWSKAEHTGTGNTYYILGSANRAYHNGSGNTGAMYGAFNETRVTGSGTSSHNYVIGTSTIADLQAANASVNYLQAAHVTTKLSAGTVDNNLMAMILDLDVTGGTVSGDLEYLRIQNDTIGATVSGTSRAINSLSTLPSEFSGSIQSPTFNIGSEDSYLFDDDGVIKLYGDQGVVVETGDGTSISMSEQIDVTGVIVSDSAIEATSFIKTGGTSSQFLKADGSVDTSTYLSASTPSTPGNITSTIVGQTIEIEFDESTTSNIDYYQVWSSDDGGDFGIIAQIPPTDFSATMTVVDTSFSTGGTMSYRVYAVKSGIYSSPGTTSKTYTVGTLDVTDMTVINLNTAYYIQYEKPASRFIDHIEIYMDSQTTQGALNRSNASIIYSGQNTSFMKSVGVSNNFHQFWVEVVTT